MSDARAGADLDLARNRRFYDALWRGARLLPPERFNTWGLVRALLVEGTARLEIGPGLRPRLPIAGTHFLDISTPALRRLQAEGGLVVQGHAARLPYPDGAFALLAAFDIVEHVADDAAALAELARVAAPGAALLLAVPLHPERWGAFDEMVGHCRRYRPAQLVERMARHGFTVESSVGYGMQPRAGWLVRLGMWFLAHRQAQALWWYDQLLMPLALRRQAALPARPGLAPGWDTGGEALLVARRRPA